MIFTFSIMTETSRQLPRVLSSKYIEERATENKKMANGNLNIENSNEKYPKDEPLRETEI